MIIEDNTIKEDLHIKSKKRIKNRKMKSFKSSLEKLFHLKPTCEKSVKHEDTLLGVIPQTLYLSPPQAVSLSRNSKRSQIPPASNELIRHSCSDFVCRRSNTFCMLDGRNFDNITSNQLRNIARSISPLSNVFYPLKEENYPTGNDVSSKIPSVINSKSVPTRLSKSHLNISKSTFGQPDIIAPSKRSRKKSIFNCSLFRKRSNSHNKLREKDNDGKEQNYTFQDMNASIPPDRCLTLPNLKANEIGFSQDPNHQLFCMDLIKDFMNRSENSLQSSSQRISVESHVKPSPQQLSQLVNKSLNPLYDFECDLRRFRTSKLEPFDQRTQENPSVSGSSYSQGISPDDRKKCQRTSSPLILDSCASDNSTRKQPNGLSTSMEKKPLPCGRQIATQIHCQSHMPSHRYLSSPPTDSAFEFWTRPYQEKLKASRRRLLDDKVGSSEAFLRNLSPHSANTNALYDDPYLFNAIVETDNLLQDNISPMKSQSPISHSHSFYNADQYQLSNHDNVFQKISPMYSTNPVTENRLLESPKRSIHQISGDIHLSSSTDPLNVLRGSNVFRDDIIQRGRNLSNSGKIWPQQRKSFGEFFREIKDSKSIDSSTEFMLTRTPTPPHSFAESSSSIVYPAPNEFLTDFHKSQCHAFRQSGTVNLLFKSENSDENEESCHMNLEATPPIPPPRTDSVIRSLKAKENADVDKLESEYEFRTVFSGTNVDRCDIQHYHSWLQKLPYKPSEFPNMIQGRESTSNLCENVKYLSKHMDLLKLPRKSIKSWTTSDSSKPEDDTSNDSQLNCNIDSNSLKRSFSVDQSLNRSESDCNRDARPQYSHLYSLKTFDSQIPKPQEPNPLALKINAFGPAATAGSRRDDVSGSKGSAPAYKRYPLM